LATRIGATLARQRAEEALRQRQAELDALIESMPCGVYAKDREGRYSRVNRIYEAITALPAEAFVGRTVHDLASPEVAAGWDAQDDELYARQEALVTEQRWSDPRFPGGTQVIEVRKALLRDANGRVLGLIGTLLDITARVRAEDALRRSEEDYRALAQENSRLAEQAFEDAETKARLLQEVNHRVKNSLASILGLLYLEQRRAPVGERAIYQAITRELGSRIEGLAMVQNMLSATEWAPVPLAELARQTLHTALRLLPAEQQVSSEISPSAALVSPKQANSLALALHELVTNTIKYALPGRQQAHIGVRIAREAETVLLEYRDDGPGFPEAVLRQEQHNVGLFLLQTIVGQDLGGTLALQNAEGALSAIRFPARVTGAEGESSGSKGG
jgi:PAS domain S-box-containing protein